MSDEIRPIVVGVDGSPESLGAARWAVAEARLRGRPVQVVNAYTWPVPVVPMAALPTTWSEESLREAAQAVVDDAVAQVAADGVPVSGAVLTGPAPYALMEAARGAELLVVGHRGRGGFTALLLGSVAATVAAHAHCPVAVIRPHAADRRSGGLVVVGADGSPPSATAVSFAFEEADRRGAQLGVVHAWRPPALSAGTDAQTSGYEDPDELAGAEAQWLREWIGSWQDKYPRVAVRWMLTAERPAGALVEAAGEADLVVVGSRGHGGFAGLLLGSVSQQVLNHAPCPVVVAR
jgi:nucleotide-binding universal stress UspA family protein